MSAVTADTPFAQLADGHAAKCVDCDLPAVYIVLIDDANRPTYCAVHFVLVAARASGMFA